MKTVIYRKVLYIFLLLLFFFISCYDNADSNTTSSQAEAAENQHLVDAELLVDNINQENNSYTQTNVRIIWKGENGADRYENHSDCSGFLKLIFDHSYGYKLEHWQTWMNIISRPLAEDFFSAISEEKGFMKVRDIYAIQSGDIISIKYLEENETNTGHVMIISDVPYERTSSEPDIEGTVQYEVEVIDSSSSGHGPMDNRYIDGSNWYDGVGKGVFRLYTDCRGIITGYTWSTYSGSNYYTTDSRPVVIGRYIQGYKP